MDIAGSVALITGGASGLGGATTQMLASAGAKTAITSPTDFICVVSVLSACGNFSKFHRGILTTM